MGIDPRCRNGTYSNPTMKIASNASRTRTRRQYSGVNTIGRNFTATANPNATAAKASPAALQRRSGKQQQQRSEDVNVTAIGHACDEQGVPRVYENPMFRLSHATEPGEQQ